MNLREMVEMMINPAPSPAGAKFNDVLRLILHLDERITRLEQANVD